MAIYRRERSTRLLVIGLVLTSLVTITLDFRGGERGPLATGGRMALSIVSPLQEGISKVVRPIASFVSGVAQIGSLRAENARLQKELEDVGFLQSRLQENEARLRELEEMVRALAERVDERSPDDRTALEERHRVDLGGRGPQEVDSRRHRAQGRHRGDHHRRAAAVPAGRRG
jgi:hypothetical protein